MRRRLHRQPEEPEVHRIVEDGLQILENLEHRGAVGADPLMGDGAGMLVQIPHAFFADEAKRLGFALPDARPLRRRLHLHAAGRRDARRDGEDRRRGRRRGRPDAARLARRARRQYLPVARRRRSRSPSRATARSSSAAATDVADEEAFERRLYIVRKVISARIFDSITAACRTISTSSRCRAGRVVYKGMFLAYQLGAYYRDLHDPRLRVGAGARPPALLDQHLPVVAAGASLPDRLPQRRDQHRPRQRQLDGGAAGERVIAASSATTSPSSGRSPTRASPTPPASTTRSSSSCAAATRCRTRR